MFCYSHARALPWTATLIFVAYLIWLRRFNVQRARLSQELNATAADYTVEVSSEEAILESKH